MPEIGLYVGLTPGARGGSDLALNYNFNTGVPAGVTFTRSGLATMWDGDNDKIVYAPHNLIQQSNDLDTSPWTTVRASVAENTGDFPSGVTAVAKSWTLTSATGGGSNTSQVRQTSHTLPFGGSWVFSFYAKADGVDWCMFQTLSYDASDNTYLDLANGVPGTIAHDSVTMTSVGSGWYRCEITWSTVTDLSGTVGIYLADADGDNSVAQDGSASILVAGVQHNANVVQTYHDNPNASIYYGPRIEQPVWMENAGTQGIKKGLLIEGARTNSFTYSEEQDHGNWTKLNTTTTANDATLIWGTQTAELLSNSDAGGSAVHRITQSPTVTQSERYTISAFVKYSTGSGWVSIFGQTSGFAYCYFDVQNGTVGTTTGFDDAGIEDYGGGVYRIWASATSTQTTSTRIVGLALHEADNTASWDSTGNANQEEVWVTGLQFEAASSFPSSYIPTFGATVTRPAETAIATGVSGIVSTQGAVVGEFDIVGAPVDEVRNVVDISDSTDDNRIMLRGGWTSGTGDCEWFIKANTATQVNDTIPVTMRTEKIWKLAISYAQNDTAASLSDSVSADTVREDNTCDLTSMATLDEVAIGHKHDGTDQWLYGHVYSLAVYKTEKTDDELVALSAITDDPELDYLFTSALDADFTFTRSTTATYFDSDGVLQTAAIDGERIDHPTWGTQGGLLMEDNSTNRLTYSEQADHANWSTTADGVTISANDENFLDGNAVADTLTEDGTTGFHRIDQTYSKTSSTNIECAFSVFVKLGTGSTRRVYLSLTDSTANNGSTAVFDIPGGNRLGVAPDTYGTGWTAGSSFLYDHGNGWYRIAMTATTDTGATMRCFIGLDDGSGTGAKSTSYEGDAGESLIVGGMQLEESMPFPTSYIQTTTASVSRGVERCVNTSATLTDGLANQTANPRLTLWGEYSTMAALDSGEHRIAVYLNDGSNSGYVNFYSAKTDVYAGGTRVDLTSSVSGVVYDRVDKVAYATSPSSGTLAANGTSGTTDTTGNPEVDLPHQLNLGGRTNDSRPLNGHIYRVKIYDYPRAIWQLEQDTT